MKRDDFMSYRRVSAIRIGIALGTVAALISVLGCGADSVTGPPDPVTGPPDPVDSLKIELSTISSAVISNNVFSARLNKISTLRGATWKFTSQSGKELSLFLVNVSGLMIGTRHDGLQASTGVSINNTLDRFKVIESETDSGGLYLIDRTLNDHEITNWPEELGAPINEDGSHKLYGDRMAWAAYTAENPGSSGKGGVQNVRLGMSVYVFDDTDYQDAIFVRYDITNVGSINIPEVLIGFYSDTDLLALAGSSPYCAVSLDHNLNQSAYDLGRGLLYAYMRPEASDGQLADDCYGFAAGFAFLDLSSEGVADDVFASRIVTRFQSRDYFPRFSEPLIQSPESVIWALQGLDADNAPMTNPITGETTRFAFSGDPETGTGWLDERNDIRHLLSKPAFALDSGETKSVALVWIATNGSDFGDAISKLKGKYDAILAAPELWDY